MPYRHPQAVSPWPLLAAAAMGSVVLFCLIRATGSPQPFGVPIPAPPAPLVESDGIEPGDTDVLAGKIAPAFLEFLAPQPDGASPLRYPYSSARGGFDIMHPMGTELMQLGQTDFLGSNVDAHAVVHLNQPLKSIDYSFPPRRNHEAVTEFIARARYELEQQGAEITPGPLAPLELHRYRLHRLEFTAPSEATGGSADRPYHFWYVGPLGPRILLADFTTTVGLKDKARPLVGKVMTSFTPSQELAIAMLEEDPDYGEWAGTEYAKLAERKRAAREAEQRKMEAQPPSGKAEPNGR